MLFRFAALACILLLSLTAQAQRNPRSTPIPLQVHGQVRYAQGGRPAEFVLVRLESFGGGIAGETTTDRTGKFLFTGLMSELYIVSVRVAGFKEVQQQCDLRTQLTDYVQLQLVADEKAPVVSSTSKRGGVIDANVPGAARAEFEKGREALLQGNDIGEGIAYLERAVKIYPKYTAALMLLGTAYMDQRQWDKAETVLKQVLLLDPNATVAHLALGEVYLDQRKYSESETELLAGIKLDSKSTRGHLTLGRLYYELGDITKAGPQVGTALQLDPKLAQGHLLAGNIYLRARQPDNALIEFEEYLRLEPNGEFSAQAKQAVQRIKEAMAKR